MYIYYICSSLATKTNNARTWPERMSRTLCCSVLQCVAVCCIAVCCSVLHVLVLQCVCRAHVQNTATHGNTWEHMGTHGNTRQDTTPPLQHTKSHGNKLQHTNKASGFECLPRTHYNTLQHTATRSNIYSKPQPIATHCNTLHHTNKAPGQNACLKHTTPYTNTLQYTATHSHTLTMHLARMLVQNTLQPTATRRNTPQHTNKAQGACPGHAKPHSNTLQQTATH